MHPSIVIREERPEDVAEIHTINALAFGRAAEAEIVNALRARGMARLSLVAVSPAGIVGHILFSPVLIGSEENSPYALGLAPMAVIPAMQNRGIGTQLVYAGLESCRKAGYECVVVLGHPGYYARFGFVTAAEYGMGCEFAAPAEAFMIIELRSGALRGHAAIARYQPEFSTM
jgi:putative acetyltransferase